jgi:hypothetical protein
MTYPPAADHPLAKELTLMARRAEPDLVLKARYLGFRKELLAVLGRKVPGAVVRLVAEELARVNETVLTEARQWREAGTWDDHRQHLVQVRAAALFYLFLKTTATDIARANDSHHRITHVQFHPGSDGD